MIHFKSNNTSIGENLRKQVNLAYDQLLQREDVDFFRLHEKGKFWRESTERGKEFREKYDQLVIVGIGGSSLGVRVIDEMLGVKRQLKDFRRHKRLYFLDNVDPIVFLELMSKEIDWSRTGWVLISKSGRTLETLALTNFVSQELLKKGIDLAKKAIVISEEKLNPLNQWANENDVPRLEISENVGGRFSVLTPVGMFPAAFLGLEVESFRQSIPQVLKTYRGLIEELVAQTVTSFSRKEFVTMFWFYSRYMKEFGAWLEQLWAESLAKKITSSGEEGPKVSTPLSCIGTSDQHSLLQQVMEGQKDKFVWFLRFKDVEEIELSLQKNLFSGQDFLKGRSLSELFSSEAIATRQGMEQVGVSCLELVVDKIDEFHLGQMFVLFEMIVGTLGEFYQINAFDQPGVDIGKKLTLKFLTEKGGNLP